MSLLEGGDVAPCRPVGTTPAFVIFQFPVSACGTTMREEGGYVVYENELSSSYEVASGPLGSITRDSVHELSFQCRYFGSEVVSLVAEVNTVPPPLPVTAQGPLSVELRLANGQCDAKGCSDASVHLVTSTPSLRRAPTACSRQNEAKRLFAASHHSTTEVYKGRNARTVL
ncbi:hypothetical protein AAFF_G00434570 [Aldrovandia affinis]|uniref:ZP domain-containing protein n=1 Tax=Aldrovandia affinis TaxID=143900 RepID=A0AAD7WI81_9TELE|nr:hypothetical protein AAFF_G00434570 [Aldrovandia affinis]